MNIKISPNYSSEYWFNLKLKKNDSAEWEKAILVFRDRIEGRYFKPLKALENHKVKEIRINSGFIIMPIICLLIETLEQFWNGNITTNKNLKKNNNDNIPNDSLAFHKFFNRSQKLSSFFDSEIKSNIFYSNIRCGLLHQGQTKGKSLIHIKNNTEMLSWINKDEGISIQRKLFLKEIEKMYEEYIEYLKKSDLNYKSKFKRKMDYIANQK